MLMQIYHILCVSFFILTSSPLITFSAENTPEQEPPLINVTVHSALTELNEFRPGYIYLAIENKSDTLLTINKIDVAEHPPFITLMPSAFDTLIVSDKGSLPYLSQPPLIKGESRVFPVFVKTDSQVKPGDYLLLFSVWFEGWNNGKTRTGNVLAEHQLKVKVFGENEVLGPLSNAVTFLIFPGIIMIVVAGLAWKLIIPNPDKDKFPVYLRGEKITDPRFWVIAITLSLLMVWKGYPVFTEYLSHIGWLNTGRRDYISQYGFQDIFLMWLFSVILGTMLSLFVAAIFRGSQIFSDWKKNTIFKKAIKDGDGPLEVLKKIARQGVNNSKFVEVTISHSGKKGFLIEPDEPEKKAFWIIPFIHALWGSNADKLYDNFRDYTLDENVNDLNRVLAVIQQGLVQKKHESGLTSISWASIDDYISELQEVQRSELEFSSSKKNVFLAEKEH